MLLFFFFFSHVLLGGREGRGEFIDIVKAGECVRRRGVGGVD